MKITIELTKHINNDELWSIFGIIANQLTTNKWRPGFHKLDDIETNVTRAGNLHIKR